MCAKPATTLLQTVLARPYLYRRDGVYYLRMRTVGATKGLFTVSLRTAERPSVKNDSSAKELKFLPGAFETQARAVFDAVTLRSGDSNEASRAVSDYLKKTTVSFVEDNGFASADSFHGMISKRDLMVDPNDSASWETGKAHIDETMQALRKDSEWGAGGLTVESKGGALQRDPRTMDMWRMGDKIAHETILRPHALSSADTVTA